MADWSQLPKDLLQLISSKLDSEFYQLRFRSVCSSWRSSVPKNHHHHLTLPSHLPTPSDSNNLHHSKTTTFPLSKRTIFLITPPTNHHQTLNNNPWLIKIGPDSRDRTRLWNPLSRDKQLPLNSPHIINFNEHRVIDLGREFVIGNFNEYSSLYMEKVVVLDADMWGGKDRCSVLLTIHISGKIAFFRGGDERWTIVPEMPSPFDDVCVFKGRPVAVDGTGRTVALRPDLSLDLVAEPVFGGDKKFLVESDGELLLVDKYLSCFRDGNFLDHTNVPYGDVNVVNFDVDDDGEIFRIGSERAVRFDVFRLDEKEKKWVEVRYLGDRVLFLGEECAFSASASDLCIGNGNCVIFRDYVLNDFHSTDVGNSVFHLDQRRISPLSDFPSYSKLFWPPPEWVGLR